MATKLNAGRISKKMGIDFLCASVYCDEGEVVTIRNQVFKGCFSCWRKSFKQFENCAASGVFTHACAQVAAYASAQAQIILGRPEIISNNEIALINSSSINKIKFGFDKNCSSCSLLKLKIAGEQ